MYASARHKVIAKSMDKSRRPAALPDEAVVTKLKYFVTSRLKTLTSEKSLTVENYVLLQSLVVCRLTLFNSRRGEEPSHWWCAGSHCSMVDVARNPVIGGVPSHTVKWQTWRGTQSLVVCRLTLFNGRRGEEPALSVENYVLLQSLVVCRLTQFNGRRGEEPALSVENCSSAVIGGVPAHTVQW